MKKKNLYILLVVIIVVALIIVFSSPKEENKEEQMAVVDEEVSIAQEVENKTTIQGEDEGGLPIFDTVVSLEIGPNGFNPQDFLVKTKDVIRIDLTSKQQPCLFKFKHPDLQGVKIDTIEQEIATEIFGKPLVGGYNFYCEGNETEFFGTMEVQ